MILGDACRHKKKITSSIVYKRKGSDSAIVFLLHSAGLPERLYHCHQCIIPSLELRQNSTIFFISGDEGTCSSIRLRASKRDVFTLNTRR